MPGNHPFNVQYGALKRKDEAPALKELMVLLGGTGLHEKHLGRVCLSCVGTQRRGTEPSLGEGRGHVGVAVRKHLKWCHLNC